MPVVGAALLGAVRFANAAVHVERDRRLQLSCVHTIDPRTGQIGQCREVGLAGQPCGLEAAHLAGRRSGAVKTLPAHYGAHRRIVRETFSVVDVLVTREAGERD